MAKESNVVMTLERREALKKKMVESADTISWQIRDLAGYARTQADAIRLGGDCPLFGRVIEPGKNFRLARDCFLQTLASLKGVLEVMGSESKKAAEDERDANWKAIWGLINNEIGIMLQAINSGNYIALIDCRKNLDMRINPCREG